MYNTDLPSRADLPSTGRLLRSTVVAALVAAALLVTTVLPAEYGLDPTGIGRALGLAQMGEIKTALAAEAASQKKAPPAVPPATASSAAAAPSGTAAKAAATQQHTMTIRLKPGQGAEIKLAMKKGARTQYEWSTMDGPVNYDTHGDPVGAPKDFYHGYGKGRNATRDSGTLVAAFDGSHGWFWRNRSKSEVTVTLKASGEYERIERVL